MFGKILCVIVCLGSVPESTRCSIGCQSYPVSKVVFADKPYNFKFVGERAGAAMRDALFSVDLEDFDYILRVDGDVVLPSNFVEESLKLNVDLVGSGGYAQLIRTSAFMALLGGVYPVSFVEDSLVAYEFINSPKYTFSKYVVFPVLPPPKKYGFRVWVRNGFENYRLGVDFVHNLGFFREKRSSTLVGFNVVPVLMGWLLALFQRQKKYFN